MSKKQLLLILGFVALGFTFLAAVNATSDGGFCGGFGNLKDWFTDDSSCEDILPARLAVLAIGLGVFFTCAYFGEKADREKGTAGDRPRAAPTASTSNEATTNQRTVSKSLGFEAKTAPPNPVPEAPAVATAPEFKTCPDCAEEVRAAARKCRFCGYEFADVTATPGTSRSTTADSPASPS